MDKIISDLKEIIMLVGTFPSHKYLKKNGNSGLSAKIAKIGTNYFRKILGYPVLKHNYCNESMSDHQEEIIIGSLLGDGCLSKSINGKSCFIEGHGWSQVDYLTWKYFHLKPLSTKLSIKWQTVNNKKLPSVLTQTFATPEIHKLETEWYARNAQGLYKLRNNKRIKIIPDNLQLTPLIITIWYLDDGYNIAKKRCAIIATYCFTRQENEFLVDQLKTMGIKSCFVDCRNRIYISAGSYLEFINLVSCQIKKYDIPLYYKTDLSQYVAPKLTQRKREKDMFGIYLVNGKYKLQLTIEGKSRYFGHFATLEEAKEIRSKIYNSTII